MHLADISPLGLAEFLGARDVPERSVQERKRAISRSVFCLALAAWLSVGILTNQPEHAEPVFIVVTLAYAAASLAYGYLVFRFPDTGPTLLYIFVVLDPMGLVAAVSEDKRLFALLIPLLLAVVVASGLRYGMRMLYLACAATLVALIPLFSSESWRTDFELALSFVLLLALVPVFFSSLVRRIDDARAIELERARLETMREVVVARSSFLSKVSHELRSPLQGIVSALDVFELKHGHTSADDEELIGRMRRSSLLLNTQLRDLLTLAKGEAGRLEIRPEPFEVKTHVEVLVDGAHDLAHAKGLRLVLELPSEPIFVVADGARIDQVLTNLLVNSIRYTDVGEVRISLHDFDPATPRLRFVIADTGPGIPQAVLPTLLEPDKVVTGAERRGEGSGIGLAVVRTLVEHLAGRISVTSDAGRGTTFTVDIPAEPIDAAGLAKCATEADESAAPRIKLRDA
jgi:signal transduction histidine kinase